MSEGYTKLFSSLIHSTVWREDVFVKVVWITMLAMADRDGIVTASVPGLADAARVPLDACEAALEKFQQPDRYSRTPDNEGRRIRAVDGGWELLNYWKYRQLLDAEDQREKARVRKQRQRKRDGHAESRNVTDVTPSHDIAEAEAEAEAEASPITETKIAAAADLAGRARETAAAAAGVGDPEIQSVIEAALMEPQLRRIPRANVIDVVQHTMPVGNRQKPAVYLKAVSDTARDTLDGELAQVTLQRLRKYLENARPPRGSPVATPLDDFDREQNRMLTAARLGNLGRKGAA